MWLIKLFFVIFLGYVRARTADRSIAFVIDDTNSMTNEINQVKENVNLIFDTVLNSKKSLIDNFILVTFNDPTFKVMAVTRDRATFKNALALVDVHSEGNIRCPEYSMSGIEKALELSHPSSYIYVFTDATARDYKKLETVMDLAIKKQSQIVFLLTGHCSQAETHPEYEAYFRLAAATAGAIFHMETNNIGQVFNYIADTVESRIIPLVDKKLTSGSNKVPFKVDSTAKGITIAVAGKTKEEIGVKVYKPDGVSVKTETLINTPGTKIVKVDTPVSGDYSVTVETKTDSTLRVTAKSEFDFSHGFSITRASSLNATTTQPIAGSKSNILIQLETPDESIKLKSIDIYDLNENARMHYEVKILDKTTNTYLAAPFIPPAHPFKIRINAENIRSGETLSRYSKPIDSQKPIKPLPRSLIVEILEGSEVIAAYNEPLQLTCKVNGYPEPTITWVDLESGMHYDAAVEPLELPYDFVAVLDVPHVTSNHQYRCMATKDGDKATKDVNVKLKNYFEVVSTPEDVYKIAYKEKEVIPCRANANPPAKTTWFFNDKILTEDDDVLITEDTLTIKHMQPNLNGTYSCVIENDRLKSEKSFKIFITGLKPPVIDKTETKLSVLQGSNATLTCRLLSGIPTPHVNWTVLDKNVTINFELHNSTSIVIRNVKKQFSKTFKCEASNPVGTDQHNISLNVEYPPTIKEYKTSINVKNGSSDILHCLADGNPTPSVTWKFTDKIVVPDQHHQIYQNNSLKITGSMENSGKYTCEARNKHGVALMSINVNYTERPIIDKHITDVFVVQGSDATLTCKLLSGKPTPHVNWTVLHKIVDIDFELQNSNTSIVIRNVKQEFHRTFECEASNVAGSDQHFITLNVEYPPTIKEYKTSINVRNGSSYILHCLVYGEPRPSVTWNFTNKIVVPDQHHQIYQNNSLKITGSMENSGKYTCEARNKHGVALMSIDVNYTEPPVIDKTETKLSVLQGSDATLTCRLLSGIPTPHVNWTVLDKNININFELHNSTSIILRNVKKQFSKTFKCEASNPVGTDQHNISLNVEYPPTIKEYRTSINVTNGSYVILHCLADGNPTPSVTWNFTDKIVVPDQHHQIYQNNSLKITGSMENSGKYTCEARNKHGVALMSIDVNYIERPIIDKHVTEMSVVQGSDATLTCKLLSGKPTPHVNWTVLHKIVDIDFELQNSNTSIFIRNVKKEFHRTFKCEASNVAGSDQHFITLNVEYPPTIKEYKTSINVRNGSSDILHCLADGNPTPSVTWNFMDKIVVPDQHHRIYQNNSLKVTGSMEINGKYTCEAWNKHGIALMSTNVNFVVPVSIRHPDRSTLNTSVGQNILLGCQASGYPKPNVEWVFHSSNPKAGQQILRPDNRGTLFLKNVQLDADGDYTCRASHIHGTTNITYHVNVNGPPKIVNVGNRMYKSVEGDLALRIPCKVTGRPKPAIVWSFQDYTITNGTEKHDIEDDGTLIIKNIDYKSRGYHMCKATNYLGTDQKIFYVDVSRTPYNTTPSSFVVVKKGEKVVVNCTLPQGIGSKIKWFKNGVVLSEKPLVIYNATDKDSGVYTCRVSDLTGAQSASIEVILAFAPVFYTEPETTFEVEEDSYVLLDCMNKAEPPAQTQWYFNGKKIDIKGDYRYVQMHLENIGQYRCVVSNEIGSINRTFVMKPAGCPLHIEDNFSGNFPLMVATYPPSLKTTGNHVYIHKNQLLKLSCPTVFTSIREPEIIATCKEANNFYVNGYLYKFSELKCTTKWTPVVRRKGFRCGHENTEIVGVGFIIRGEFAQTYEVCMDKEKSIPMYTRVSLRRTLAGIEPKDPVWFNSKYVPFDFESMYQCNRQNMEISLTLNNNFHDRDACCFGRRQLVSPKDVMPGSEVATYNNLNVVPQWSTCHAENWNDMEDRVRALAKTTIDTLVVWTGQAHQLTLPDSSHYDVNVTITDGSRQQAVSMYLWKVIQNPRRHTSVAIVQVNIPDLKPEDASKYVLCFDVCDSVRWMKGGSWRDVTKGYIYCCRIREFEEAFDYRKQFSNGGFNLLK